MCMSIVTFFGKRYDGILKWSISHDTSHLICENRYTYFKYEVVSSLITFEVVKKFGLKVNSLTGITENILKYVGFIHFICRHCVGSDIFHEQK